MSIPALGDRSKLNTGSAFQKDDTEKCPNLLGHLLLWEHSLTAERGQEVTFIPKVTGVMSSCSLGIEASQPLCHPSAEPDFSKTIFLPGQ